MAYSGEVDSALITKLQADATLVGLMPDGVFFDIASHGKTRFVVVRLMSHTVERYQGGRAYEAPVYLAKAVELTSSAANTKAAGARIDALLDGGTMTVTGYGLMTMQLEEYIRYTESDPDDDDLRWQHRGGMYSVWVAPT